MSPEIQILMGFFSPWAAASLLLGMICGALFFIVAGRRIFSLPLYLALGGMAGVLGQVLSLALELEPWPLTFGQLHVAAATAAALALLSVARLYRL